MNRYWIFDREDTPQGFPLFQLIRKIREVASGSSNQFVLRRSQGYGSTVCSWDQLLDNAEEIAVLPDDLERLAAGTDEWFYDLEARCVTPTEIMIFGVHDSSALFVEASAKLAEKIVADFKDTRAE